MRDIINWLLNVEHMANKLYQYAADYFIDNSKLHKFLVHTAEDEAWHYHVMGSAAHYFQQHHFPTSPILLDDITKHRIEEPFKKNIQSATLGTLTEEQLIDCIIETEFSEWNDFFLYVVNTLKKKEPEFSYAASQIQHHLTHVEHYIKNEFNVPEKTLKLQTLTAVHDEKILVVEDDDIFADLLRRILSKEGTVSLARNGQEALEEIDKNYFRLIVSDIDMPIMDGLTFYTKAVAKYPNLKNIFMFITGDVSLDRMNFFKEKSLPYLQKPSSVIDIRRVTTDLMFHTGE